MQLPELNLALSADEGATDPVVAGISLLLAVAKCYTRPFQFLLEQGVVIQRKYVKVVESFGPT